MSAGRWILVVVAGVGLAGCAQHAVGFVPVAALAVKVAPEQEADVVWLLKDEEKGSHVHETVLRCHNTEGGPVCVAAKEGTQ